LVRRRRSLRLRSSCRGATPRHGRTYRNGCATSAAGARRHRRICAISEGNRAFLPPHATPAFDGSDASHAHQAHQIRKAPG
jgi:hypothetical protein